MSEQLDDTLSALSDPTRRAAISLLCEQPLRSSDLAEALGISRPTMSRHLKVLRQAGLVEEEIAQADARERLYQVRRAAFAHLREWLDEVEAFWGEQLTAFKTHAERKDRRR